MLRSTLQPPRPITPDVYSGRIFEACLVSLRCMQSASNPDGLGIKVGVEIEDDAGPACVFDHVPSTYGERIGQVFHAAAQEYDSRHWRERLHELIGQTCRIIPKNIQPRAGSNAGRLKAVVSAWLPPVDETAE